MPTTPVAGFTVKRTIRSQTIMFNKTASFTAIAAVIVAGGFGILISQPDTDRPVEIQTVSETTSFTTNQAPFDKTLGFPPCEVEDGVGCYWDASTSGNGVGCSFTTLENDTVIYWDEDACEAFQTIGAN